MGATLRDCAPWKVTVQSRLVYLLAAHDIDHSTSGRVPLLNYADSWQLVAVGTYYAASGAN